ncbi:MAG: hypothetical protein F6K26_56235, partial [Moorea sp. SIO2I5]|nr:hypothetical protein [Moorena sp. SIO2I5]
RESGVGSRESGVGTCLSLSENICLLKIELKYTKGLIERSRDRERWIFSCSEIQSNDYCKIIRCIILLIKKLLEIAPLPILRFPIPDSRFPIPDSPL